jgi:hypothetical protein
MLRDSIKNEEYFINFLDEENERINKFLNNIETESVQKDRIPNILAKIFGINLGIIVAKYSLGKDKDDIIKDYDMALHFLEMDWDKKDGYYVELLWLLSMGILLNINENKFNTLIKVIDAGNYNDYIMDYLIGFRKKDRKLNNKILFKKPYGYLMEIFNATDNLKIDMIKIYLKEKWYKEHKDCFWHNNHKSQYNTYFGYWSFEAGAIVKILNINDNDLRECKYYPYDMVHW